MQMEDGRSIQEALRLGKPMDIFYYTSDTTFKQSIPTTVNNRFFQALNTLGAGTTQLIISKDQGISDIIFSATLPAQGVNGVDYTNLALPRGYLYAAINRISIRYSSSSQFFQTGGQCLIQNLREMPNPTTRDNLFALGGAAMSSLADFAGDNLTAFAFLNFSHSSPNGGLAKPNPFPSDLVSQSLVVTLELNPLRSLFSSSNSSPSPGSVAGAPDAFASAYFQVKAVQANDAGDLMKMPMGSMYSYPCKFYQNEVNIRVGTLAGNTPPSPGAVSYPVQLTGMRSGQLRSIILWCTKNRETTGDLSGNVLAKNFTRYYQPTDVELTYNGSVFYRSIGPAAQFLSLISTETPPLLQNTSIDAQGDDTIVVTNEVSNWLEMPFGQVFEQLSGSHMYVAGKNITSAVVNLTLSLPDNDNYTLHIIYSYNCALLIKDGMCEFSF